MNLSDINIVSRKVYQDGYRWLMVQCIGWENFFPFEEKENRSPAVVAQIIYIEQLLARFKTFDCTGKDANDLNQAHEAINQASQILDRWQAAQATQDHLKAKGRFI